jgi:hypothetical protein
MFLAGIEGSPLQAVEVGLVAVFGVRVDGFRRGIAIELADAGWVAVEAGGSGIAVEIDSLAGSFGSERVDRNEAVGMCAPEFVVAGDVALVAHFGGVLRRRGGLEFGDGVAFDGCGFGRVERGGCEAGDDSEQEFCRAKFRHECVGCQEGH